MGTIDTLTSLFNPRRFQQPGAMSAHPDEGSSSQSLLSATPRRRGIEVSSRTKLVLFATTGISVMLALIGYELGPDVVDTYQYNLERYRRGEITLDELQNQPILTGSEPIHASSPNSDIQVDYVPLPGWNLPEFEQKTETFTGYAPEIVIGDTIPNVYRAMEALLTQTGYDRNTALFSYYPKYPEKSVELHLQSYNQMMDFFSQHHVYPGDVIIIFFGP